MEFFVRVAESPEGQESLIGVKENGMLLSNVKSNFPGASLLKFEVNGEWVYMDLVGEVIFPKANQIWNEDQVYIVVKGNKKIKIY
jgi:hypothetical protein